MKNLLLCLLLIPAFALADISIEHHIPAPHEVNAMNNIGAGKDANGGYYMKARPSASKSHFNSTSSSGGNIVGGRPVTTTVNNGYGNTGTINTQAASTYGKMGGLRAGINSVGGKALGVLAAASVFDTFYGLGSKVYDIYDHQAYGTPLPAGWPNNQGGVQPLPNAAPAPTPTTPWTLPPGGYDPNAEVIILYSTGAGADKGGDVFTSIYTLSKYSSNGGGCCSSSGTTIHTSLKIPVAIPKYTQYYIRTVPATPENIAKYADMSIDKLNPDAYNQPVTQEDFYNATMWALDNMPKEVATSIMNALHDMGVLGAPDSTVFDPASYTSPPYTAADTGQAQQDRFTINQDGSMTHQVITRPDLQGNQQLAPEKQPSTNPTTPTDPTNPTDPKPETPEIDWDIPVVPDTAIPTQEIPIFFNPDNAFSNNGVCPQPRTFTVFKRTYGISYEPMCDFGNQARPMIILCGVLLAMLMVFSALNGGKEA